MRCVLIASLLVWFLSVAAPVRAASFVYVSIAGEKRVAAYERDPQSGRLTYRSDITLSGEPGALAVDPQRRFLLVALRSTGNLVSCAVDRQTGALTQISEVPAGADPAYVAVDQSGRYLLTALYQAGKVMVHRISDSGVLEQPPIEDRATDDRAHAIVTDRSNQFVFVPHTRPNAIFQFRFQASTGGLTPNAAARVQVPENTGPRHLWFHPTLARAYTSNEQGSSISVFAFDRGAGQLELLETVSTLPEGFGERNSTSHLEVHPSGQFVYVANRGHNSLAMFRIDPETGRVTAIGHAATEAIPRSFQICADGRHLYAAGQAANKLAVYDVDVETGKLDRIETYETGPLPWWVLVTDLTP